MTTAPDSDLLWGREELNLHSFVRGSKHSTADIVILNNIKMSFKNKYFSISSTVTHHTPSAVFRIKIKSSQIESNQIKVNQIKSNQIKSKSSSVL